MYIVHEVIGFNHPLKSNPDISFLDSYTIGKFEIAYIAPENVDKVDLSGIIYRELTEAEAKSSKWAKADYKGKLGIVEGSDIHDELLHLSLDQHATKPKVHYYLTDEDKAQAVVFFKHLMQLDLDTYYSRLSPEDAARNAEFKKTIEDEIAACEDIFSCRFLLHTRFEMATSSVLAQENNWGQATLNLSE